MDLGGHAFFFCFKLSQKLRFEIYAGTVTKTLSL